MNTLLTHRDKKKLFSYLPDVWFLAILLLGWGGLMSTMWFGAWHTVGIVLGVFLLSVTGILVKQLIRRNGAISVFMGILFLMCSLFFSLSLFSELREFSSITEPNAIQLLLGGVIIVGGSLVMSMWMMLRGLSARV